MELKPWQELAFIVVLFGSVVDLAQFGWLSHRFYRKTKRTIYNKVRRKILSDMKNEQPNSKNNES